MIIALDLETTGLDNKKDKIIEIALVKFDENTFEIVETYETLINPGIPIPDIISNICNIFDEDVKSAPFLDTKIKQDITEFIQDLPILGHNTYFDRDFLIQNGIDLQDNIVLDTFVLSNMVMLYEKSLNLGSLCETFGIELNGAHRAINDTLATIKVFERLISTFKELSKEKKELLNYLFSISSHDSFNYYSGLIGFHDNKLNNEIFTKQILKIVGKYEKMDTVGADLCVCPDNTKNFDNINQIFSSLPNSELRENQLLMANITHELLSNNKKVVIEAPTGVGKTFAYLVPSIIYSLKTKEQVIISTNTKALQDQIYYKDLKFLHENLGQSFSYTKLKGRNNYLSVARFLEYMFLSGNPGLEETTFFAKICLWLFDTEFGELDELNYFGKEFGFLKEINAEHFFVLTEDNDFKNYEYIFKARSKSTISNIVIINHSLLIQDTNSANSLFGQIKNLIIDEAHNLEDTTTDAVKKTTSLNSFKEISDKVLKALNKQNCILDNIDKKFENLYSQIYLIIDLLVDYSNKKNTYGNDVFELLVEKDFFTTNETVGVLLNNLEIGFIEIFNQLSTTPDKVYNSLKSDISQLEEILEIIKIVLSDKAETNYIPIFSYNLKYNHSISYTLLKPGEFLQKKLWDKVDSLLLTSATLQVGEKFDYIKSSLSLNNDFEFISLKSDFDYSKQALLYIPNDLGSVKYNNLGVNDFLLNFFQIIKGNAMMLLTSYNSIKDVYLYLNIPLKKQNTTLLAQNIGGSKHKITNHFKKYSSNSIILGTDSFWEGIDIPGDDLKYLIIHKFPFLVPTDPIFKARAKLFSDSFKEYSIPKAILKTKQGFGRLIRTKTDTGIVVLLDDRVINTSWGEILKTAFPKDINIKIGSSKSLLELLNVKK